MQCLRRLEFAANFEPSRLEFLDPAREIRIALERPRRRVRAGAESILQRGAFQIQGRDTPLRRELMDLERRIESLTAERTALEHGFGVGGATPPETFERYAELARQIAELEARWLEVGSTLEAAEALHAG